ncbi:SigB/SigF/SigG family RNA polymerase sigma factor [Gelria sp. Kuro-4]|jgi:RNA polymerase sporulation-specific sigma factor|uniref:SigB/SigF/SigG family RNA polymerase sigma factor n=1 Tax=Gelria sp. Kuro-4 TaxID=2796927 RepID=UPI001BEF223C|nr:SigB/SigF/SigG family RNA polymerase sigma factor [Gelria sp. Kuro-4]MDI3522093.1 polymerase sporulation-specific sigma factor [Bacillota bacterium]MDK2926612.1 polymerase sporulation-specific sigma factor [Bacillota bacterium]BCV25309.1 RNA polymerase sigma factor [Gelria sp. Kuro-4]
MTERYVNLDLPERTVEDPEKVAGLVRRAQAGDRAAREKLIQDNLRLVVGIARRFCGRGYEFEDLFQVGTIGLMKAVDKFDLGYGVQFSTYAVPMIVGEIRRFLRDDNPVRVSRSLKETALRARRAAGALGQRLGREPTLSELAAEVGVPAEELVAALEATQAPASLSDPIYQDEGAAINVEDQLGEEEGEEILEHVLLGQVLEKLTPRERFIIQERFYADKTQAEVAAELGLSQVQISRLEKQVLLKIKRLMAGG